MMCRPIWLTMAAIPLAVSIAMAMIGKDML